MLFVGDSRVLFTVLVAAVMLQRLVELVFSARNQRRLRQRGGIGVETPDFPVMVLLHALFPVAMLLEVWWLSRPVLPWLAASMIVVLALAQIARYWTIRTLGDRWTVNVVVLPGEPVVRTGPYRFLRHPNYVVVAVEIFALPLVHTAWLTAVVFTALNGAVLAWRITTEERALESAGCLARDTRGNGRA